MACLCDVLCSDVVLNLKDPRLFFAGCIGETRPSVRYLIREEKERFGERL